MDLGAGRTAKSVVAGDYHTCAILDDDAVKCWGWGEDGELGNGGTVDATTPVAVAGLPGPVAAMMPGGWHSNCALTTSGGAYCWGANDFGQLGNGTTTLAYATPIDIGLSDIVQIGAGQTNFVYINQGNVGKLVNR